MSRRTAVLLLLSVFGLLITGVISSVVLVHEGVGAAQRATDERLMGIGQTLARALAAAPREAREALLSAVRRDNGLEDAYLITATLRAAVPARASRSLLRLDPDRALQALAGKPAVGPAYQIEADPLQPETVGGEGAVLAGYFAVSLAEPEGRLLLVLEAGASFAAAPQRLRRAAYGVYAAAAVLALLCLVLVGRALRAAERERLLYGRAQRGEAVALMASMVTHEIRNPLGTIRAGVELLGEDLRRRVGDDDGEAAEIVRDILGEIDRLKDLSAEYLTLASDPPLRKVACDLRQLCEEAVARLRRDHPDERRLRLLYEGPEAAPLRADPDRLRQVLLNLTQNAVQAMDEAGELRLRLQVRHQEIELQVEDDGPGIDELLSQRLFKPYMTTKGGGSSSSSRGGSGLGLVVSRRIAEKHGGSLELLRRAPGQRGACFALRLPRDLP